MAKTAKKHQLELDLAPNLDPEWTSQFLIELRLQGVSGPDIGVAVAEANSHCADSGESAQDTFGDPADYAKSLQLTPSPEQSSQAIRSAALPTLVQLAGMMTVQATAIPLARGEQLLEATWGLLGSLLAVVTIVILITTLAVPAMRLLSQRKTWQVAVAITGVFLLAALAGMLPMILLDDTAAHLPVWAVLTGGVVVLIGGAYWDYQSTYLKNMDLISSPDAADSYGAGLAKRVRWASTLFIPVATLVLWIVFFAIVKAA